MPHLACSDPPKPPRIGGNIRGIAEIDAAACAFGMPAGTLELADRIGLDICLAVSQRLTDADLLDAGVILGTGFAPFRRGPMAYTHERGTRPADDQ